MARADKDDERPGHAAAESVCRARRVAGPGDGCRSPGPAHGRYGAHGRPVPATAACPSRRSRLRARGGHPARRSSPATRATTYGDGVAIPFLLLPADNAWNTPVDALPLDPNSADYIAHMDPAPACTPTSAPCWDGAPIGIPYIVVPGTQPKVPISFSTTPTRATPGPYPIPPDAPVEGAGGRTRTATATCSCSTPTTRGSTSSTTPTGRPTAPGRPAPAPSST